jgi:TonB family protein
MIPFLLLLAATNLLPNGEAADEPPPAHRAHANLPSYFADSDYPADALRRHEEGNVTFTLDVDEAGRVSACRITGSSGSAALDEATCRILRERARLTPALDGRGRPVADRLSSRIHWTLSAAQPEPEAPPETDFTPYIARADYPPEAVRRHEEGQVDVHLTVSAEGRVTQCVVTRSSGSAALDRRTCELVREYAHYTPPRDEAGHAVPGIANGSIHWTLPRR